MNALFNHFPIIIEVGYLAENVLEHIKLSHLAVDYFLQVGHLLCFLLCPLLCLGVHPSCGEDVVVEWSSELKHQIPDARLNVKPEDLETAEIIIELFLGSSCVVFQ